MSGAQVLEVMTEDSPAAPAVGDTGTPAGRAASPTNEIPSGFGSMARHAGASMLDACRGIASAASPALALETIRGAAAAAGVIVGAARDPVAPLPFNGGIGKHRRIVWASFPLDDFLAMRGAAGCKVNDVVLAVIAGALARYLPDGVATPGARVRAMIPVNVRRADEHLTLGNRVSAMFATLSVGVDEDPLERLHTIAAEMRAHKESGQARGFDFVLGVSGVLPAAVTPLLARLNARWPFIHTVCTNVPGPRETRYLLGRRVLEIHPFLPLAVGIGLGFAIMSYDGALSICATADANLVPDADRLAAALRDAQQELRTRLGVGITAPAPAAVGPVVSALMTPHAVTISPREPLARAWLLMQSRRIRHLPVVDDDGRVLGLVTHRDLLAASGSSLLSPAPEARFQLIRWARAEDVMETHVSTAAPNEPAAMAGERMVRQKIGCLPVIGYDGRLIGIVTEEDFLRWATARMAGEAPETTRPIKGRSGGKRTAPGAETAAAR